MKLKYTRALLKVSGGAMGNNQDVFSKESLNQIAKNIINATEEGIQLAIVVGGGNIFRGRASYDWNFDRVEADNIGILATLVNSIFLKEVLASQTTLDVRVMTSLPIPTIAEQYNAFKAKQYLSTGSIVIFGGGIGQPFMSTDYPSVQRAIEIEADIVLMAKNGVNGVYNSNPKENVDAKRYQCLNCADAINLGVKVADATAFILAKEYNMPMYVFDFDESDSIIKVCFNQDDIGTLVSNDCKTLFY